MPVPNLCLLFLGQSLNSLINISTSIVSYSCLLCPHSNRNVLALISCCLAFKTLNLPTSPTPNSLPQSTFERSCPIPSQLTLPQVWTTTCNTLSHNCLKTSRIMVTGPKMFPHKHFRYLASLISQKAMVLLTRHHCRKQKHRTFPMKPSIDCRWNAQTFDGVFHVNWSSWLVIGFSCWVKDCSGESLGPCWQISVSSFLSHSRQVKSFIWDKRPWVISLMWQVGRQGRDYL